MLANRSERSAQKSYCGARAPILERRLGAVLVGARVPGMMTNTRAIRANPIDSC